MVFEAEVTGLEEMRFWVLAWGSPAEVLEPEAVREAVKAEARALVARYGGREEDEQRRLHLMAIRNGSP